ncbi:MAG TPA: PilN domain-containing protein [Puia sp.]|nr:PilN domain-containing protein [Puia sp.]
MQVNNATGIEIFISSTDDYIINAVEIKVFRNKVTKEREYFSNSIRDLAKNTPLDVPVAVSITGKGILTKKISATEFSGNYFDLLFPNANPNDFQVSFNKSGDSVWIYLIRKNLLADIVSELTDHGFIILNVSIGISALENILPFIDLNDIPAISTLSCIVRLKMVSKNIQVEVEEEVDIHNIVEYNIGNQYIKSSILVAFSSILSLVTSGISALPILDSRLKDVRIEFIYSQYYKKLGWIATISVLILLVVNFSIYIHYYKINQERQISENVSKRFLYDQKKSLDEFNSKSEFLRLSGWLKPQRVSYFADRIASLVPENTMLTNMQVYPLREGQVQSSDEVHFKMDTVIINGICEDPENLAVFLGNLKNSIFVESVVIKEYSYKKEKKKGYFNLEIILK